MKLIKNIIHKLETESERISFFDNVWATESFKEMAKNPHSIVGCLKKEYISKARYYYNMQNQELERPAFTSWYQVLSLKKYDNLYIHDLYLLHELTHICTMPYVKNLTFDRWQNKMRENEVYASLISEVLIYFENIDIRKYTFKEEIWADNFFTDENIEAYKKAPCDFYNFLKDERDIAYSHPRNKVEQTLFNFKKFSFLFYDVWKSDYEIIESSHIDIFGTDSYDHFLSDNLSENNVLFEKLVKKHYENYIKHNFIREKF